MTKMRGNLYIAPEERAGSHLLIQLYGPPRCGKTYTALRIARVMVGPKGRIGVLDTESGRARLYSDKVPGGFVVGELTPPQGHASPSRPSPSSRLPRVQVEYLACTRTRVCGARLERARRHPGSSALAAARRK